MNKLQVTLSNLKTLGVLTLILISISILIFFIVYSILSISIKNSPTCITFQFKISANTELGLKNELKSILNGYNLKKLSSNKNLSYFESATQIVQWSDDIPYSLNVCSKEKNLLEWAEMLSKIQNLILKNDQNLRIYLHPASDLRDCKKRIHEGYLIVPADFNQISNQLEC